MDLNLHINALKASQETTVPCHNIELKELLSRKFKLQKNSFSIYSCKEQALFSLLHSFNTSYIYIYAPSDKLYTQTAKKLDFQIEYINRFIELNSELLPNSIVLFTNPSFPDGNYYELDMLLENWKEKNIIVIIDESYLKLSSKKSLKAKLKNYSNLYIIESLTPFYGEEKLHLSLIHSISSNLQNIDEKNPSCHIPLEEQQILTALLNDTHFKKVSRSISIFNKELLINQLEKFIFIKDIYPTDTNYFLFSIKHQYLEKFIILLDTHNIKITHCKDMLFLDENFFSLTIPRNKEIKKLLSILKLCD